MPARLTHAQPTSRARRRTAIVVTAISVVVAALLTGLTPAAAGAATPGSPVGGAPWMAVRPGWLNLTGWAADPDTSSPIRVFATVDYHWASGFTAGLPTNFHGNHGYNFNVRLYQGNHRVCVWARNVYRGSDTLLRCLTQNYYYGPVGGISQLASQPGSIRVEGWTYDNDDPTEALTANVLVDGVTHLTKALFRRTDVPQLTARTGIAHGIWDVLPVAQGTHHVCVAVANIGYGSNTTLLCRTLTVDHSPLGAVNSIGPSDGKLRVRGWAVDPDAPNTPIDVGLTIDGRPYTGVADVVRTDVIVAHLPMNDAHGFDLSYALPEGPHSVCVTALNVGQGFNRALQCETINLSFSPVVTLLPPTVAGSAVTVAGWATDPDTTAAVPVQIAVDGAVIRTVTANATGPTYSGHRFDQTLTLASGTHTVCVTATNVGFGTKNSAPACSSVTVGTSGSMPAQNTPAPVSTSRYIRNISTASLAEITMMRNEGVADALANPSGHRYLILLDIGGQDQYDGGVVLSAGVRFVTYAALVRDVQAYVYGYHSAQRPSAPVTIAIGTNNDMDVSYASGQTWARTVVNPIAASAISDANVSVAGADDIEPGFRASYYATSTWLAGFLSATTRPFVFNGSADGCAWTVANRSCNNGWTMAGLYHLAAGAAPTRMVDLPQVYNYTMADQWKYISLTGIGQGSPRINFGGPLTEWTACEQAGSCGSITGHSAWARMWSDLHSDPRLVVSSLPYSTDLRIDR